jgi:hypothetical protein
MWVGGCISCMNLVLSGELHSYKNGGIMEITTL